MFNSREMNDMYKSTLVRDKMSKIHNNYISESK